MKRFLFLCGALLLGQLLSPAARAESIYGLLNNDPAVGQTLVVFDSNTRTVTSTVLLQTANTISPLASIDVRPATGQLYGFDSTNRQLYIINPADGALTPVGGALPAGTGGAEIDFNPTVDRIRLVDSAGNNLRLNPNDGSISGTDGDLAFDAGDTNEGATPDVRAVGYTNSVAGAVTTTLYDIDVSLDILATQNPANAGLLQTVGSLGVDLNTGLFGTFTGFDISGATGTAYLTDGAFAGPSQFYTVDLTTGAATSLGEILNLPTGRTVASIAVVPEPASIVLLAAGAIACLLRTVYRRRATS